MRTTLTLTLVTLTALSLTPPTTADSLIYSLSPPPTCTSQCTDLAKPTLNITTTTTNSTARPFDIYACSSLLPIPASKPCFACITGGDAFYQGLTLRCKNLGDPSNPHPIEQLDRPFDAFNWVQVNVDLKWTLYNTDGSVNRTGVDKATETRQTAGPNGNGMNETGSGNGGGTNGGVSVKGVGAMVGAVWVGAGVLAVVAGML